MPNAELKPAGFGIRNSAFGICFIPFGVTFD